MCVRLWWRFAINPFKYAFDNIDADPVAPDRLIIGFPPFLADDFTLDLIQSIEP